jgi:hypothetical protein
MFSCVILDHNEIKLKNKQENYRKYLNTLRVYNSLLNDQWVMKEIGEEIKKKKNPNLLECS